MKRSIQLSSLAAAVALSAAALAPATVMAGTSATVGVSNFYLFRGVDLTNTSPQVSGSIDYSHSSGAYAGAWVSNLNDGSNLSGQEYDLYVGYAAQINGLSINANLTSYEYPKTKNDELNNTAQQFGKTSEFILNLGYEIPNAGKANISLVESLQGGYYYSALSYGIGKVSATIGTQVFDQKTANDYTHVDLSYAINNEVSVTLTQIVDQDSKVSNGGYDEDPAINLAWKKTFNL